jgi:hypothetical protein
MVVKPPCSCSRCAKRKARIAPGPISYFERFVCSCLLTISGTYYAGPLP